MGNVKDFFKKYGKGIVTGVGSVGTSFVDGAIGNFFERSSLDYQAELNEQAALNAYNRQLAFWDKQNAYNDPSSQINRLIKAGLNPALLNSNGVNNVAGGLSSVSQSSPGHPNGNKPSVLKGLDSLTAFAKSVKEMGFLDVQIEEKLQNLLTIAVDRELKQLEKGLKLTETEKAELDYEAFYEASFGQALDGGEPRIKNNQYTERINEARANIRLLDAKTAFEDANTQYTQALQTFAANRDNRDAQESLARIAVSRATAAAQYAMAEKTRNDDLRAANAEARAIAEHELQMQIDQYLADIHATEAEIQATRKYITDLWSGKKYDYNWHDVGAMVLDFIHNNVRIGGTASYSTSAVRH